MARLLSIILLLLLASPAWAFPPLIAGKTAGGAAAPVCSESTDYIGSKSEATGRGMNASYFWAYRSQAVCGSGASSCNLATGHIQHNDTTQSEAVVCIYNDTTDHADATAPTTDSLVGQSGAINLGTSTGDKTAAASGTHSVSKDGYYWVVLFTSSTATVQTLGNSSISVWYKSGVSGYPTCPANMPASMGRATGQGPLMVYFTLGP